MKRGALLFEVLVALALFVMGSLTIGRIVLQCLTAMETSRLEQQACDLARSTMAQIEAGIVDPNAINGPAVRWDETMLLPDAGMDAEADFDGAEVMSGSASVAPVPTTGGPQWMLEVETEPFEGSGLWLVSVRASLEPDDAPGVVMISYTLRQLVRLGDQAEDQAGEEDELMNAARRGNSGGRP